MSSDKINHVVVLMLENRSFDSMLGWLYSSTDQPKIVPPKCPTEQFKFFGLDPNLEQPHKPLVNKYLNSNGKEMNAEPGKNEKDPKAPACGPGEEQNPHTIRQLYSLEKVESVKWDKDPGMLGFAQDFAIVYDKTFPSADDKKKQDEMVNQFMKSYTEVLAPVIHGLAKNYAVCDEVNFKFC